MKKFLTLLITAYQQFLSLDTGSLPRALGIDHPTCPQHPTCSNYAIEAIERHGAIRGSFMALRRVLACTPKKLYNQSNA